MSHGRRGAKRDPAGLFARYAIEGEPGLFQHREWRRCRILDVSEDGAALELLTVPSKVAVGSRLLVELEISTAEVVGVQLRAEVRNIAAGTDGELRVGTRYVEPTTLQLALLNQVLEERSRGAG